MQNAEYYTPTIEELFVGYECERLIKSPGGALMMPGGGVFNTPVAEPTWKPFKFTDRDVPFFAWTINSETGETKLNEELRTPYLTQEQIESEGWECMGFKNLMSEDETPQPISQYRIRVGNKHYWCYVLEDDHTIHLLMSGRNPVYCGDCKSINEFRKICLWIGIKS